MNKETLEEAAEKAYPIFNRSTPFGSKYPWIPQKEIEAFKKGANWQKGKSYTEEDMIRIYKAGHLLGSSGKPIQDIIETPSQEWFEQFKKK